MSSRWLSPDGATAIEAVGAASRAPGGRVDDLEHDPRRQPGAGRRGGHRGSWRRLAWSPDGSQIAYTGVRQVGDTLEPLPSVYVVDLERGTTRQLAGREFGHIRQMAWSPDGSQLTVVAGGGPDQPNPALNPLVSAHEASLYLVGVDGC